ncbi:MAG TPA: DUF4912 domain-containing protein [Pyrinomonadaceae bacterium]|nr:DUF4912 domain-containing protein [Pyrinomonadaceae bacterium]
MPFFPGSSQLATAAAAPPPEPAVADKLAELSADEPLPETYTADRIRLLPQSPRRLYLYWEFAKDPFETLQRAFGPQAERYELVVRLVDTETGAETLHSASETRSQWLDVGPARNYRADVGLYARGLAFIRLLSSAETETPRASASRAADSAPEFQVSANDFARVLDDAGYASDALEVSLEAADRETGNAATLEVARRLGGAELPPLNEGEMAELRGLLAALALGLSLDELRLMLSAGLGGWLDEIVRLRREGLDAAHLLDVLRSVLGFELNRAALAAFDAEAARRAPRSVFGASEVNLPLRPLHLWMPSMMREG